MVSHFICCLCNTVISNSRLYGIKWYSDVYCEGHVRKGLWYTIRFSLDVMLCQWVIGTQSFETE